MAEMTIRLQTDPKTGRKNIIVSLKSDEDSLPLEHEQLHRALVGKLIEGGIVKASELGTLVVERETQSAVEEKLTSGEEAADRQSRGEGA